MKKNIISLFLALFLLIPFKVFASGGISVSSSSITIEKGQSKNITISAYNTIGDVSISSSDTSIATVSPNSFETGMVEEKQTKTGTIKITGANIGSTTINLKVDAATFDGEDLSSQTIKINVNVIEKTEVIPKEDNRSKNNKLKELSIEGYELVKENDKSYSLIVNNNVSSITVKATSEDAKATIKGTGNYEIKVGENNITVTVIAENGSQNKINIKITRKDGYYLTDLDSIINDDQNNNFDIILKEDDIITESNLNLIKSNNKVVNLNYYDENKSLLYSWILDGSKITDIKEFNPSISLDNSNIEDIQGIANYAEGLLFNFNHNGSLSKGIKIKLYVGNKYKNDDTVNVYHHVNNSDKLNLIKENVKGTDGYIEFEISECSEYFVTKAKVNDTKKTSIIERVKTDNSLNTIIIGILITIIIVLVIVIFIIYKKYKKVITKESIS